MKQADIEVGGEYAWRKYKTGATSRVRVVEKGLLEGPWAAARRSHVMIEFLDDPGERWPKKGGRRSVNSVEVRSTWVDWLEEDRRYQAMVEAREEQRRSDRGSEQRRRTLVESLGFEGARVSVRNGEPEVIFKGDEADRVLALLLGVLAPGGAE